MLEERYFTKDEILETLKNADDYGADSFDELFNCMFNSGYYIIGAYKAADALATFINDEELDGYHTDLDGTFGAIELVKQYETDQFGEVDTPLDNPEKIANMIEYIRGENLFNEVLDSADIDIDSETTEENIKKFVSAAETL